MKLISNQTITQYSEVNWFLPEQIANDYMLLKLDVSSIITALSNGRLEPQFGSGSPEGVVKSNDSRVYYDTSGVNAIMYVNETVNSLTGWKQVNV